MLALSVRHVLPALVTGLLYTLSLPEFDIGVLAWIALIPLHAAIDGLPAKRAFRIGWLAGTAAFSGSMSWVITAMHLYGKVPLVISFALMLLLSAYLGLYVGLYAHGFRLLQEGLPRWAVFIAPCLWVALEWIRGHFLSGLPWSLLGYSQYRTLAVIQIADITAVYGVSFLIVFVNLALFETIRALYLARRLPPASAFTWRMPAVALGLLTLTLAYGQVRLTSGDGARLRTVRIGVVQANIDQAVKWDERYRRETQDRYARLTMQVAPGADLVVWPEAATPFLFEMEPDYRAEISALVRRIGVPLLFGSPTLGYHPDRRPYLMNSAYLLSTEGQVLGRYSKRHLVPFGEYIPLHGSLLFFLDKLVEGIGDFIPGPGPTVFDLPDHPPAPDSSPAPEAPRPRFGVVICYEVIFPDEVREFATNGADFMVTITNDAWFGRSSAPYQHFGMVVLRAVENRMAFARSANTGISGFIDGTGRIVDASPIFNEAAMTHELRVGNRPTFYSRYGDVFAYGCVIIAATFLTLGRRRMTAGATPPS